MWNPDTTIEGFFTGEDVNHDNLISRNEISAFSMGQPNQRWGDEFLSVCPSAGSGTWGVANCTLSSFSFNTATLELTYSARALWSFYGSTYGVFEWTEEGYTFINTDLPFESNTYLRRTPETYLGFMNPNPPIPEPSTWAMLASGLLIAGAAARRRARGT